jgi:copper transport protein
VPKLSRWRRSFALAAAAALAVFVVQAAAHAELVRSVPAANETLARAPAQIELFFTEAVEGSFSAIQVFNSKGAPVDNQDTHLDPADNTHLLASLRALPDGVYTVSWRTMSAIDGHITGGAYPFVVGLAGGVTAPAANGQGDLPVAVPNLIAKWLIYISMAVLAGGQLFVLAVWEPAQRRLQSETDSVDPVRVDWSRWAMAALAVFVLAMVGDWLLQVGQASGAAIAAPWAEGTATWLFTTRLGAAWLAQMGLGVALAGMVAVANVTYSSRLGRAISGRLQPAITLGTLGAWLLAQSLVSHAAADPQPVLPVLADWIHLTAASVWVGGLIYFAIGLWALRNSTLAANARTQFAALVIPRFSALALTSVALLIMTGVYSAVIRIGTFQALYSSAYGWALIIKLLVAWPMAMMGAINLLMVTPALQRAVSRHTSHLPVVGRFRGLVTGEMMLGFILLFSVSLLTSLPPARNPAEAGLTGSARADDVQINLSITPGRVGVNAFRVRLLANGQPLTAVDAVELRFTPSGNMPSSQAELVALGGGDFAATGGFLGYPETWQVQVVVRRPGKFDAFANFNYTLGTAAPVATPPFPWNQVSGGLLLGVGLAYLFAFSRLAHSRRQFLAVGLLPAVALAVASVGVLSGLAFRPAVSQVNPIPPNAESVARGLPLYSANCQPCHGAGGRGDGPVGLTLNPRPADLTTHAVQGVHTDAQLYNWITNGYPGSLMPGFGQRLSERDRWDLVNFIRTFAPR